MKAIVVTDQAAGTAGMKLLFEVKSDVPTGGTASPVGIRFVQGKD